MVERRRGHDTPGFSQAFRQFGEAAGRACSTERVRRAELPKTIGAACIEMLNSANLSFALCRC